MQVTRINLTADASRGMSALGKDGTPAVFSDAVRVDLAECSLLFISGKTPVDDNHTSSSVTPWRSRPSRS